MRPKRLASVTAYHSLLVLVSFPIVLSGVGCATTHTEVRYIEGPEMQAWSVSWMALAARAVDSLGEAGIDRVLLLPASGAVRISFPDAAPGTIAWSHGSEDATRRAMTSAHHEQSIPTVERFFTQFLLEAQVPLVDRNTDTIAAIMAEADLQAVFTSPAVASRVGRLAAAEGVCMIKYDLFYDVSIDVIHGTRRFINRPRYVLHLKCVDARDGSLLYSGHADTEIIRTATAKRYGMGDPYYLIYLAAMEPDLALQLQDLPFTSKDWLLAKAIVHTHPMYAPNLRRPDYAAELIRRAQDASGPSGNRWLVEAEMSYAMCTLDLEAYAIHYSEAEKLLAGGAAWWRDMTLEIWRYSPEN